MLMPKSHCVELLPNFFSWLRRRFWSILRWLEIFWRDEIENFSMNCSNMAYISLFFTISVKFLGIIVITKSAFENVSKIFGWRIFSKYFLTTNWKIKMIFLFSLKILFLFILENHLKCFDVKCLNIVPLFIFKISSHLLHFFPLMASRTSCSEICVGFPAGLATDWNDIELILVSPLVIEPLVSPFFIYSSGNNSLAISTELENFWSL